MPANSQPALTRLVVCARTDAGRRRTENQDAFLVAGLFGPSAGKPLLEGPSRTPSPPPPSPSGGKVTLDVGSHGVLLLVADGMGGPAGGGRASHLTLTSVLEVLRREWVQEEAPGRAGFVRTLVQSVEQANARVHREARESPGCRGMGTTLTLGGVLDGTLILAQVGDSRGYLLRDGKLVQLTRDQSMVQKLIDAGAISEREARVSPQRNVILQAVGTEVTVNPVITSVELRRGDLILLCSDGLSGPVADDEIVAILAGPGSPSDGCSALLEAANVAGGPDNVTVVLARVEGEGVRPLTPGERVEVEQVDVSRP